MLMRLLSVVLLALALTGAPFGMGKMMDSAHAASSMHEVHGGAHQHHGQSGADHSQSTPHFVVCAACVAAVAQDMAPKQIAVLTGTLKSGFVPRLEGIAASPDLPPPRI